MIVEVVGRGMKKRGHQHVRGEPLLRQTRYARMVPSIVTVGQGRPTCRDGEGCAPLPDQSLPKYSNLPMVLPRQQFAETALETATSPDRGASSCLWWHTRTERRVWVSHPQVGA